MKTVQYLNGIIVLATFIFMSCSHENGAITDRIDNNTQLLYLNVVKNGFTNKSQTRTNTDENYVTSFTGGESVGLFAVKNGAILSDCNNLKLTYNGATGKWEGNVYYYSGAQYYAYAPYKDEMAGKSLDQIKADYPYSADQSTSAKFIENDLLVSSSCTADPASRTLQISFVHARALLVFEDVAKAHYLYTSGNGELVYVLNGTSLTKITLGGTDNFAGIGANGTLLYIVKPGDSPEIVADYNGAETLSYTAIEGATSTTANTYQKLTLTKKRDLEIGDFFYKDGSFYPGSTTQEAPNQDDCVGVVAYLYKEGDSENYITKGGHWGYGATYKTGMVAAKYEDTETISYYNKVTRLAEFVATLPAFTGENTQVSGWHIPLSGELLYLCSGTFAGNTDAGTLGTTLKDKLNPYIEKAGGVQFKNVTYFSGQDYSQNTGRAVNFTNGELRVYVSSGLYRITLAF